MKKPWIPLQNTREKKFGECDQLVTFVSNNDMITAMKLTDNQKAKLRSIDFNKQPGFVSAESLLTEEVGEAGSPERVELEAKAKAWYYGEVLREI